MKKLLYLFLLPSILFSQTTPSVTPRVDGEGSIGTETYRWGEIHTVTPSVMDNSSKVPTTSWIRNYLINNTPAVLQPEVVNLNNKITEDIEVNKIYAIISNYSINRTIYLPKITEDNLYSEISFQILLQSNDKYITLVTQSGDEFLTFGTPDGGSYWYNLYGTGDRVTIRAIPSASNPGNYNWFFVDSTDNLISKGTLYIPRSLLRKESLVFTKGDHAEGKINFWWDDMDFTVSQGVVFATKYDFLAFRDLETSSPYTEFVQPVKAPTPTAADNSTNVATTAWVQDEIALKQNASNALTTDTAQDVTGTKTYRTSALYYGPATPAHHTPFGFGCGEVAYWGTRQYTNGNLVWQSFPTGGGTAQNALGFIFGEDGSVPSIVLYNTPTAPTAAAGTNTTQIATTAFCGNYNRKWSYSYSGIGGAINASPWTMHAFGASGTLTLPLASSVASGVQVSAIVVQGGAEVVLMRSGSDQFVTPTGLATTYTLRGNGSSIVLMRVTTSAWVCVGAPDSLINAAIAPLAPLASPALTGTPTAPTAAVGTNTTQLATTEFVQSKAAGALLTEATPASSSATGTKGMIRYDSTYVYVCVATDTWIRLEKTTW